MMGNMIHCRYNNKLTCTGRRTKRIKRRIYEVEVFHEKEYFLFATKPNVRTICSGVEYQDFIWGSKRYTLWVLPRGKVKCLFLDNVYYIPIRKDIIIVSTRDHITYTREINDIVGYWEYLRPLIPYNPNILFLLDSETLDEKINYNNISILDSEALLEIIRERLLEITGEQRLANILLELIMKKMFSPQTISKLIYERKIRLNGDKIILDDIEFLGRG
ncbi:MAG: hypothetical protein B6U89_01690 [Desulfurococcales archaeon ex4484_58]|nr:MAG: hypothetical protein B6U89_01690 [Desulfurococcales archaeon ex4484_58]